MKTLRIKYIPIFLLGVLLVCSCKNDNTTFEKGIKAFKIWNYSAAIDFFQKVINNNRYDTLFFKSYYFQAKCYYFVKDYPSSIKNIDTLIKYFNTYSSPQSGKTFFNDEDCYLGDIYLGRAANNFVMKRYSESQKDINTAFHYKITDTSGYYHISAWNKLALGDSAGYISDSIKAKEFTKIGKTIETKNFNSILKELKIKEKQK